MMMMWTQGLLGSIAKVSPVFDDVVVVVVVAGKAGVYAACLVFML